MRKTIGYIVHDGMGGLWLEAKKDEGHGREGILLYGAYATLFRSRENAKAAIRRTMSYANREELGWSDAEYEIKRVEAQS